MFYIAYHYSAARVHWNGSPEEIDNWLNSIVTSELTKDSLQIETIEHLDLLFEKIGFKEEKVACFWDRFDGMTFVEMASIPLCQDSCRL